MSEGAQRGERGQQSAGYDLSKQAKDRAGGRGRQREIGRIDSRLPEFVFKAGDARLDRFDAFRRAAAIKGIAFEEPLSQLERSRQTLFFVGLADFFSRKNFLGSSDQG